MKINEPLKTPFGDLEAYLFVSAKDNSITLGLHGIITVNRVPYQTRIDLDHRDTGWHQSNLSMDRKDGKDTAYPWNARDKFANAVLSMLPNFITKNHLAQAREEQRQKLIANCEETIRKAKETIRAAEEQLNQLQS